MAASDMLEPSCIHSTNIDTATQPASACRYCKDGPELAAWVAYWADKPYMFVQSTAATSDDPYLYGRFVERPGANPVWDRCEETDPGLCRCWQWVEGRQVYRI